MPRISPRRKTNEMSSQAAAVEAIDSQQLLARCVRPARTVFRQIAIGHQPYQLGRGGVGDVAGCHVAAVAQHRDTVADTEDLVHPVGDVDDGHARGDDALDGGEELADLALAERGRRLVHHEDPRFVRQCPGDLDHLLLREAQAVHRRVAVDADAEAVENAARRLAHAPRIDDPRPAGRRLAKEDVLGDRQVRDEAELLVNRADAERARPQRAVELHSLCRRAESRRHPPGPRR